MKTTYSGTSPFGHLKFWSWKNVSITFVCFTSVEHNMNYPTEINVLHLWAFNM